jgi:hypothetical protein
MNHGMLGRWFSSPNKNKIKREKLAFRIVDDGKDLGLTQDLR